MKKGKINKCDVRSPCASSTSQPKSLPCKKMICTGVCSYRNRCHYIHDTRIMTTTAKPTCRKKNKDENCEQKDLFYWTPMTIIPGKEARTYIVPPSSCNSTGGLLVASLWHHFVDVCQAANSHTEADDRAAASYVNSVTGRPRLAVFQELSTTKSLSSSSAEMMESKPKKISSISLVNSPHNATLCRPRTLEVMVDHNRKVQSYFHHHLSVHDGRLFEPRQNSMNNISRSVESAAFDSRHLRRKYMPIIRDIKSVESSPTRNNQQERQKEFVSRSPTSVSTNFSIISS